MVVMDSIFSAANQEDQKNRTTGLQMKLPWN